MKSTAAATLLAIGLAAGIASDAGAQSGKADPAAGAAAGVGAGTAGTGLQIGHVDYGPAMDRLFGATRELREALLLILDKKTGPERDKAVQAAQEAMLLAQRAMTQLPPEQQVKDVQVRPAKEWPVAMARLSDAGEQLEAVMKTLSQRPQSTQREQAVATVREAMAKVEQAMAAVPAASSGPTK